MEPSRFDELAIDDISVFNAAGAQFDLHPSRTPDEARRHDRYVLENDEHVDVLVVPIGGRHDHRVRDVVDPGGARWTSQGRRSPSRRSTI